MKGRNNFYGRFINVDGNLGTIDDACNLLAGETLCLPLEATADSRRNANALFRRIGKRGLARLAAHRRPRCSSVAARRQQTPPVHLLQPAISSPPGKNARSRASKCTLAALT